MVFSSRTRSNGKAREHGAQRDSQLAVAKEHLLPMCPQGRICDPFIEWFAKPLRECRLRLRERVVEAQ